MSKFDDILAAAKGKPTARKKSRKGTRKAVERAAARPGRPAGSVGGKRSSTEYRQCSVYLRKRTRNAVGLKLATLNQDVEDADAQDLSGLVEQLLTDWLKRT